MTRVCGLLEGDFHREAVDVRLQLEPGLPTVHLDAILIEQVILNLLRNALDATAGSAQGVRRMEVATFVAEQSACVTVKDSGVGLPHGREMDIFDAFFTTKTGGLGLGLSVSRSIIRASGGRLWAARNPDRGTTVGFALPLSELVAR